MRDQRINTLTGTSLSDGSREQSSLPTAAMYAFDCQTIADGFRNDFCIVPPLTTRPRETVNTHQSTASCRHGNKGHGQRPGISVTNRSLARMIKKSNAIIYCGARV